MGALCAVCLRPIVGRGFVISETEVLHKTCASRAGETVRWQQQREIARLAGEVRAVTAVAQEREYLVNHKAAELERMRRERDEARTRARNDAARLQVEIDRAEANTLLAARARSERLIADGEAAAARADAEQLRRELALFRTLGPPVGNETKPVDERNPTEVRFSLLELDKP